MESYTEELNIGLNIAAEDKTLEARISAFRLHLCHQLCNLS